MRVIVLYNPISGRGRACKLAGEISECFLKVPWDVELIPTQADEPNNWLVPKVEQPPDAVVVVGGDGTLRMVASVLVGTSIPVYHAASGTENLFAKTMGTNGASPERVVETIVRGDVRKIDTATANGEFMLLMASVGFDADVVRELSNRRGGSITHLSYVLPCIWQFLKWSKHVITISVDGEEIVTERQGWAIIANCKSYARGLNPAKNADIADGAIDVMFLPMKSRIKLFWWLFLILRGKHIQHSSSVYVRGKKIIVSVREASQWQLDGDAIGAKLQMELACVPNSLLVFSGELGSVQKGDSPKTLE
ncbi:MAG TPA: hypothetical protein EYN32_02180 [Phycisphaerales bacterium]|nr:hypothetical protein [Phycisphaerales bacterium]